MSMGGDYSGDWLASVNTGPSDYGRNEHVQVHLGRYHASAQTFGTATYERVTEITGQGTIVTAEELAEGQWPGGSLQIPLRAAKALHEALDNYFRFGRADQVNEALQSALNVERNRLDKVLERLLPVA